MIEELAEEDLSREATEEAATRVNIKIRCKTLIKAIFLSSSHNLERIK